MDLLKPPPGQKTLDKNKEKSVLVNPFRVLLKRPIFLLKFSALRAGVLKLLLKNIPYTKTPKD